MDLQKNSLFLQRYKYILIPCLIVLLSFFIRFALISKGAYHIDTLHLVLQCEKTLTTGHLGHQHGLGYPLAVLLGSIFIQMGRLLGIDNSILSVNFMAVVFSALSLGFFYIFIQLFLNRYTAFYSTILLSLTPMYLGISVYGKSQPPAMFFLFGGLVFQLLYSQQRQKKYLYATGIFYGLLGAARLQVLILVMIPISFLYFGGGKDLKQIKSEKFSPEKIKDYVICAFIILLVVVIFYIPLILNRDSSSFGETFLSRFSADFLNNYIGLFSPRLFLCFNHLIFTNTLLGLAIALVGLGLLCYQKTRKGVFLILWFLIPLFFYGNMYTMIDSRFLLLSLVPLIIGQGYVFGQLRQKSFKIQGLATIIFVALIFVLFQKIYPIMKTRHDYDFKQSFFQNIEKDAAPNARIITADAGRFLMYYTNLKPFFRPRPAFKASQAELIAYKQELDALLDQGIPIYITTISLYAYDSEGHFSQFMKRNYQAQLLGSYWYEDWHMGATVQ